MFFYLNGKMTRATHLVGKSPSKLMITHRLRVLMKWNTVNWDNQLGLTTSGAFSTFFISIMDPSDHYDQSLPTYIVIFCGSCQQRVHGQAFESHHAWLSPKNLFSEPHFSAFTPMISPSPCTAYHGYSSFMKYLPRRKKKDPADGEWRTTHAS